MGLSNIIQQNIINTTSFKSTLEEIGKNVATRGRVSPIFGKEYTDIPNDKIQTQVYERNCLVDKYWEIFRKTMIQYSGGQLTADPALVVSSYGVSLTTTEGTLYTLLMLSQTQNSILEPRLLSAGVPFLFEILTPISGVDLYDKYWSNSEDPLFDPLDRTTWGDFVPDAAYTAFWTFAIPDLLAGGRIDNQIDPDQPIWMNEPKARGEYSDSEVYGVGDFVSVTTDVPDPDDDIINIYRNIAAIATPKAFDASDWELIQ